MCAFVVLGLVFSIPRQEIGLGNVLKVTYCCVRWDIKPPCSLTHALICVHCNVFNVTAFSYSDKLLVSVFVQLPFLESTSLDEMP